MMLHSHALLLSLVFVISITPAFTLRNSHRVFPAASFERFASDDGKILRTINPNDFDVVWNTTIDKQVNDFLQAAKERFLKQAFILPDYPESFNKNVTLVALQRLVVTVSSNSTSLYHGVDESYMLTIQNASCQDALLNATTVYGVLRGLETFSQLVSFAFFNNNNEKEPIFALPSSFYIADAPEYPYRGLLIDSSRHYLPLSLILHTLDAMAMNKLNVLHWHLTDSPSFPYKSLQYPELSAKGAFHPKRVYTIQDIQLVVEQARLRGIRVVAEVDLPGHSQAIARSHPEWMSHCPQPSEPLDPTKPEVYDFVKNFYSELAHIFPDEMIHVGGDEVLLDCWKNSSSIQMWMKLHDIHNETMLYAHFESQLLDMVTRKHNKTAIVWQEVFNLNLPISSNHTIINVWKYYDNTTIAQATARNFRVVTSQCWYLDNLSRNWNDFYYDCNPRNFTNSTKQQSLLVIGGHASMWGERVDASNFMPRVWPRASSMAERLWTGSLKSAEHNVEERLTRFRCHMVARGIAAEPIGPGCCQREPEYVHEKERYAFEFDDADNVAYAQR